jgi:hypothetical protein
MCGFSGPPRRRSVCARRCLAPHSRFDTLRRNLNEQPFALVVQRAAALIRRVARLLRCVEPSCESPGAGRYDRGGEAGRLQPTIRGWESINDTVSLHARVRGGRALVTLQIGSTAKLKEALGARDAIAVAFSGQAHDRPGIGLARRRVRSVLCDRNRRSRPASPRRSSGPARSPARSWWTILSAGLRDPRRHAVAPCRLRALAEWLLLDLETLATSAPLRHGLSRRTRKSRPTCRDAETPEAYRL